VTFLFSFLQAGGKIAAFETISALRKIAA